MTFYAKLKAHTGGLIRLKERLYWYYSGLQDEAEGRVSILLDVFVFDPARHSDGRTKNPFSAPQGDVADVLVLIDGSPKCVLISEDAVELI
jgi:hypothetical protein